MDSGFEELEHTADVAIRFWGPDLASLFTQAALGMANQLADPEETSLDVHHQVDLFAGDVETLLVTWLGELLYLGERDGASINVFTSIDVHEVSRKRIRATVRGASARSPRRYIKAATFSDLAVRRTADGYQTVIVFDV